MLPATIPIDWSENIDTIVAYQALPLHWSWVSLHDQSNAVFSQGLNLLVFDSRYLAWGRTFQLAQSADYHGRQMTRICNAKCNNRNFKLNKNQ